MKLALDVGVTSVDVETTRHGTLDAIIVERFVRAGTMQAPVRVHHEDACQASGKDPKPTVQPQTHGQISDLWGPVL